MIVILDANIISLLVYPKDDSNYRFQAPPKEVDGCRNWLDKLLSKGAWVIIPEICDYEIRRELLRINSPSVSPLERLRSRVDFIEADSRILKKAAALWAEARNLNQLNKDMENIDVDIIICAHWCFFADRFPGQEVVLATKNIKDFERYTEGNCKNWTDIKYL